VGIRRLHLAATDLFMTSHDPIEQTQQAPASAEGQQDTEALLQAEIETLKAELEQLRASTLLERADLENQRKRVARDVDNARKFANEKLLGQLLPVFDSLDAGLTAAGTEPSPLREGLELTQKQLLKVADDNGLKLLDPAGQPFNPEHHQAISQAEANGAAPGSVLTVFQKGYLLNDRLLRPALVVVARQD
jgi:molecular chaperone GrpE